MAVAPIEAAKFAVRYGLPVLAGGLAVALAMNPFHIEEKLHVEGGFGELESVEFTMPKLCQDAFVSRIHGAEAEYSTKITLDIGGLHAGVPTGYSQKSGFDGRVTSQVCREETEVKPTLGSDGKIHINVSPDAYSTFSYITNPTKDAPYTKHNGPTLAAGKIFSSVGHTIPKVEYKGSTDDLAGRMGGIAVVAGLATASESCGKAAWPALKPLQEQSVKDDVMRGVAIAKLKDRSLSISEDDIVVDLPSAKEVKFPDQYEHTLENMKKAAGDDLNVQLPKPGPCKPSKLLKKSMSDSGQTGAKN